MMGIREIWLGALSVPRRFHSCSPLLSLFLPLFHFSTDLIHGEAEALTGGIT